MMFTVKLSMDYLWNVVYMNTAIDTYYHFFPSSLFPGNKMERTMEKISNLDQHKYNGKCKER